MRYPWQSPVPTDDVESLQTDVMRFVAIIGLCLAAIFSLVNAATQETVAEPPTESRGDSAAAPPMVRDSVAAVVPDPPSVTPAPAPAKSAPDDAGFVLLFESPAALQSLLANGVVRVFAVSGERFLALDTRGQLHKAPAPPSYYRMDEATLPPNLRGAADILPASPQPYWGITLPQRTTADIDRLMRDNAGGELIIRADASVSLN